MSSLLAFEGFKSIPRLNRDVVVTEKIDGTNAGVLIRAFSIMGGGPFEQDYDTPAGEEEDRVWIRAASRNRWLPNKGGKEDNYGFGKWVADNAEQLAKLGHGLHHGEWYGSGIGRNYGLTERRFALFNTFKWGENRPRCCDVVPVLAKLTGFNDVHTIVHDLKLHGSRAVPGFMNPEGVVAFHEASKTLFKVTLEKDEVPKSLR